jgi:Tfp pilus assembly PilM family ATPase
MSKQKLSGRALVVQITEREIRIAQMTLGSDAISEQVILPTPPNAVEDGQLVGLDALHDAMEPVLRQGLFRRCRKVVFSLCSTQVISESVTVPAVKKQQRLGQMLLANMDEYFPIDPGEYQLSWESVGVEQREDARLLRVQLWAVPRAMLQRYYALANSMGLSVAAVDFCGHSHATAVDADFALPKHAKSSADTDDGVCLYINAESELLLLTFVHNGQVKLQRLLQRGYSQQDDLNEAGIVLDYFSAMPGRARLTSAVLSGGQAKEAGLAPALASLLNVPVEMAETDYGAQWLLCQGAALTALDFGDPELNHITGARAPINRAWQYGLVFLGGAALTASVLLLLTSKLSWSTELDGLRAQQDRLTALAQQNAGCAENYHNYSSMYDAYSADWDTVFDSVRTYNDNLELVLGELEAKLPKKSTVTALSTTELCLAAQVAFQSKEDAAYFLVALRDVPFMTLNTVSSLTIGPREAYSPDKMIAALYEEAGKESPVPGTEESAADGTEESSTEEPPTEGGYSLDELFPNASNGITGKMIKDVLPLLRAAGVDEATIQKIESYADMMEKVGMTISPDNLDFLQGLLPGGGGSSGGGTGGTPSNPNPPVTPSNPGTTTPSTPSTPSVPSRPGNSGTPVTPATPSSGSTSSASGIESADIAKLRLSLQYLNSNQLDALQAVYGPVQQYSFPLDSLLKSATAAQEKAALRSLLQNDPAAMYQFFLLMREDIAREEKDQILYDKIFDDIWKNADQHRMFYESDDVMLNKYLPNLLNILTDNKTNVNAAIALIRQNQTLSGKLALHLAKEMGEIKEANTALDLVALQKEINSGAAFQRDAATVAAVNALLRKNQQTSGTSGTSGSTGMDENDLLMWILMNQLKNQTGGSGIPDIFNTGASQTQKPADNRYYLTVVLTYDESLIQAEQTRKGLDRDAKVEKVEVGQ